jgi:hypothetical protein
MFLYFTVSIISVKQLEHEADHSLVQRHGQEWWIYTYTPPYIFMAWGLIN